MSKFNGTVKWFNPDKALVLLLKKMATKTFLFIFALLLVKALKACKKANVFHMTPSEAKRACKQLMLLHCS